MPLLTRTGFESLAKIGCKFKVVSTRRLTDLQSEIECRLDKRQFDEEFAKDYMHRFQFTPPQELQNAKSLIVVAMPRPPTRATFDWRGKKQTCTLPPTYTAYDQKRLNVEKLVGEAVGAGGYRIATSNLPLKLLAARSGLVEYGKNNLAYVEGMGSFMRLTAVYSDMPSGSDEWHQPKTMDSCRNCNLCGHACPTGAISGDRLMLHAERCLTYHNEKAGSIPFPYWVKAEWHNCIVGCIRCQAVCPKNKPFLEKFGESAEFTEEETELLLAGTPTEKMPSATLEKMRLLCLTDYYNEMPRNLSALLNKP